MGERFFNDQHARQKLNSTVCMFKGEPYFVHHLEGTSVECVPIGANGRNSFVVDYTTDDFDYTHVPLGYAAWRGRAYYLAREPQRINTQGLTLRAISAEPALPSLNADFAMSQHFKNCILGKHPSFDTCLRKFNNDANLESHPFDRHFAIQKVSRGVYTILYRGRVVALSENRGNTFRIVDCPCPSLIRKRLEKVNVPLE